jgi:hypothetical protein
MQWVTEHPVFVNAAGDVAKLQIFSDPPPFVHEPRISDYRRNLFSLIHDNGLRFKHGGGDCFMPNPVGRGRGLPGLLAHAMRSVGINDPQLPD